MKKSKIFLATGALILAASAIFATKASKKFGPNVSTGIYNGHKFAWGSAVFTTKGVAGFVPVYVAIYTNSNATISAGDNQAGQLLTVNGAKPVFISASLSGL
ncbi:MAG TPA: hypothetical protein VGZ71_06370 [Puia sp.]|jgi:hypothetical protein|nr:hypothetical protein [Puia sp.]